MLEPNMGSKLELGHEVVQIVAILVGSKELLGYVVRFPNAR